MQFEHQVFFFESPKVIVGYVQGKKSLSYSKNRGLRVIFNFFYLSICVVLKESINLSGSVLLSVKPGAEYNDF